MSSHCGDHIITTTWSQKHLPLSFLICIPPWSPCLQKTSEHITRFLDWIKSLNPKQYNKLNFGTSQNHQTVLGIQRTVPLHWRWQCKTVKPHHYPCIPRNVKWTADSKARRASEDSLTEQIVFVVPGARLYTPLICLRVCPSSCTSHTVPQVAARRCSQGKLQYCHTARYKASSCYHAMGMLAELL